MGAAVLQNRLHDPSTTAVLNLNRLLDRIEMPWAAAHWLTREDIELWMGAPTEQSETAIHLAPRAIALCGGRAGGKAGWKPPGP